MPREKCVNWVIISISSILSLCLPVSMSVCASMCACDSRFSLFVWRAEICHFQIVGSNRQLVCRVLVISFRWRCQLHCDLRLQFAVSCKAKLGRRTQQVCPICCYCCCRCYSCWAMRTHVRGPSKSNSGSFSRQRVTNAPKREPFYGLCEAFSKAIWRAVIPADKIMFRGLWGQLTIRIQ